MTRRLATILRQLHDNLRETEQIYMVLVSVLIGALGGAGAIGFRLLIEGFNYLAWHQGQYTLEYLHNLPPWWKILAPSMGGLAVGLITYYYAREAKGHGVPEVMEAAALREGRIRPRVVVAINLASGICIGSGGSVGREGPIVQIGSALGSTIGQWLRIDGRRLRTLVGCGAAAGIAGTFNAPVGGALFAVEIILGDFGVSQFSPIVIASVAATVVSHRFLGDFPTFEVPTYSLVHPYELLAYAGLGLLAGLGALAFIRILDAFEELFDGIRLYPPIKPVLGGAMIGVIGIWLPHVYGVGYEAINETLNGLVTWKTMLVLVFVKILAVSLTIGSGGSGGVFAPSLFIGAMLGGVIGTAVHSTWPMATGGPGAYALVGMGAVVAAATHAPITAILIIFELTADYKIILPLMISCILATLLTTRAYGPSIYTLKLLRRGIDIHRGTALNVLQHVFVRDQMRTEVSTISPRESLYNILAKIVADPGQTLFVVDEQRALRGVIRASEIGPVMAEASSLEPLVIAQDLMVRTGWPVVSPDDSLAEVMKTMGTHRGEVPVLQDGRLVGVIWPEDVIQRYNTELFKRDMAHSMASAVTHDHAGRPVPAVGDTGVAEVTVPRRFVGKTIRELNIRQNYGVSVLMIKQHAAAGEELLNTAPEPDYQFQEGDVMLVMGRNDRLRHLEREG